MIKTSSIPQFPYCPANRSQLIPAVTFFPTCHINIDYYVGLLIILSSGATLSVSRSQMCIKQLASLFFSIPNTFYYSARKLLGELGKKAHWEQMNWWPK
jgi:hypothetical protein